MLLTRKSAEVNARRPEQAGPQPLRHARQDHRPPHVPQALRPGRRRRRVRLAAAVLHDRQGRGAADAAAGKIEVKRTVCTHCSVGCAIDAVVQNGVWIRQEPVFDSPINLGAHCAKGASMREHGMTEHSHRLKYPMKLENGKYTAHLLGHGLNEIAEKMLAIAQGVRPGRALRRRLLQAQQRAGATCCASGCRCGAPTTATTRRASATRPRSPASPTPGATAR